MQSVSGADAGFGTTTLPENSPMKAPRRRSKQGSKSEGSAFEPASGSSDGESALFDFSVDSSAFPPQIPEEMQFQPEFSDFFSAEVDRTLSSSEFPGNTVSGNDSSVKQAISSANSDSLFALDFGSLMMTTPTSKAQAVQPMLSPDSPVAATFYIGESSLSASSSAAELTAIADGVARPTAHNEDLKMDPFAGLFGEGATSSGSWSALDPLSAVTANKLSRLVSVDGDAEPDVPPPAVPAVVSANVNVDASLLMSSLTPAEAAGEFEEVLVGCQS